MAGRIGDVQSVTGGYGFTLHDDDRSGNNSPCLTLVLEKKEQAEAARKLIAEAFAVAKSAVAPPRR